MNLRTLVSGLLLGLLLGVTSFAAAAAPPEWAAKIRRDHPRLFFNAQTWPAVKARAEGAERAWYQQIKRDVDALLPLLQKSDDLPPRELGPQAAWSAFVFLMTEEPKYRELAKKCLDASLRFYDRCYAERKSVNWYSTSRVHAVLAWDWLYNHLTESEREDSMARLVRAIDRVLKAKPPIYRENISGYSTGFYGVSNTLWFLGCTAFGTGIEPRQVEDWLVWGHDENLRMLAHRKKACGDDGGGASPTLGYVFGAYPWAEQNFFYTWLSATGENIAPDWPHSAWLANYVLWNAIPTDTVPLEFGYGDTPHETNRLPAAQLYSHMANIRHLYWEKAPEAAALARYVQETLPRPSHSRTWFIYPFLLSGLDRSPPAMAPQGLPCARHFETMGQVFMRSGIGKDDTYALFSCGGVLDQHRHYDALNFVIHRRGFLALDSGTRHEEFTNGRHLANYYAQTAAHNCVAIHQPGEPPAPYWGGTVEGNHGGQNRPLGSIVKGFQATGDFVYVAGDATACYQHRKTRTGPNLPEKCSLATRQFVFLLPGHFVVFDRVIATDPGYRKDWLLHTANEPVIDGREFRADHERGRLYCRTLLPEDARLAAVGGPGKEFWAAGKNWPIVGPRLKPENRAMMGQWRVEVTPGSPRREDLFLHVIQVGDQGLAAMDRAELIRDGDNCGVRLSTSAGVWEVTFAARGELDGRIRRTGAAAPINARLAPVVQAQAGIMSGGPQRKMTYQEAKKRLRSRELPPFWVGAVDDLPARWAKLTVGNAREIAKSPGGRPLHVIAFGEREEVSHRANFNSAIGGLDPAAYMDKAARKKPLVYFVGPVHGQEVEGLTGLVNLIQVMETGRDLRGKDQAALQSLGRRCRLLIVPAGNPDGTARFEPRAVHGMPLDEFQFWSMGTWADDSIAYWPDSKRQHPRVGPEIGWMGCYFNDRGINPMHDEFFAPMSSEAPAILRVAMEEGPDLAVSLHGHESPPALLRPAYVPLEVQQRVRSLAERVYGLLAERKLPGGSLPEVRPEGGKRPDPFNLVSALYHTSGATAFTFECTHGVVGPKACKVTLDEILDIQLTLYEAMLRHALDAKSTK